MMFNVFIHYRPSVIYKDGRGENVDILKAVFVDVHYQICQRYCFARS